VALTLNSCELSLYLLDVGCELRELSLQALELHPKLPIPPPGLQRPHDFDQSLPF
jgi:hypothetical protein